MFQVLQFSIGLMAIGGMIAGMALAATPF